MSLLDTLKKKALEATQHPIDTASQAVSFLTNPGTYIAKQAVKQVGQNNTQPTDAWYATQGLSAAEARAQGRNAGTGAVQVAKPIPEQLSNKTTNDYYSNLGNSSIQGIDSTQTIPTNAGQVDLSHQAVADTINSLGQSMYGRGAQDIFALQDEAAKTRLKDYSDLVGKGFSPDQIRQQLNAKDDFYTQRLGAAGDAYAAEKAAASKTQTNASGLTPAQVNSTVNQIAGNFDNEGVVKRFSIIQNGKNFVNSFSDTTKNPTDHQALIYALAKALDPESVVREGEYATAKKYSQSWADEFGGSVNQAVNGTGFLSPSAIKSIKSTINTKYVTAQQDYNNLKKEYQRQIDAAQSGQPRVLTDYSVPENSGSSTQPSAADFYNW